MTDDVGTPTTEQGEGRKRGLLALMARGRALVEAWAQGLSEDERSATGTFEHWSARDVLGHIGYWHGQLATVLDLVARHEPVADFWGAEDEVNAQRFAQQQTLSWDEVGDVARQGYATLVAQVERMDEAGLEAIDDFAWREGRPLWRTVAGNGYRHPCSHLLTYDIEHDRFEAAVAVAEALVAATQQAGLEPAERGIDVYNLACIYAQAGRPEPAVGSLREALALAPNLAGWAREDSDLAALHGRPDFEEIVASP
jgi:hypothetical protein